MDSGHQPAPGSSSTRAAADLLNSGRKVAILVGQGALNAREEVTQVADLLGAPVAKALLGKAVLAGLVPRLSRRAALATPALRRCPGP